MYVRMYVRIYELYEPALVRDGAGADNGVHSDDNDRDGLQAPITIRPLYSP